MALGALIAAQDEDDQGGLHALAPLAGEADKLTVSLWMGRDRRSLAADAPALRQAVA